MQDRNKRIIGGTLAIVGVVLGVLAASNQLPASAHGWIALGVSLVGALQATLPAVLGGSMPVTLPSSAVDAAKKAGPVALAFGALLLAGCSDRIEYGVAGVLFLACACGMVVALRRVAVLACVLLVPSVAHADAPPIHLEPARALMQPAPISVADVAAVQAAADRAIAAAQTAAPQPDKAKEAAAVLAGLGAGLQTGVQGVQALGKSNAAVGSWLDSKGGVIFMGCLGGAIVVISAVGSFALAYDVTKPAATSAVQPAGLTVARW